MFSVKLSNHDTFAKYVSISCIYRDQDDKQQIFFHANTQYTVFCRFTFFSLHCKIVKSGVLFTIKSIQIYYRSVIRYSPFMKHNRRLQICRTRVTISSISLFYSDRSLHCKIERIARICSATDTRGTQASRDNVEFCCALQKPQNSTEYRKTCA